MALKPASRPFKPQSDDLSENCPHTLTGIVEERAPQNSFMFFLPGFPPRPTPALFWLHTQNEAKAVILRRADVMALPRKYAAQTLT